MKTFRDLKIFIDNLTPKELDMTATVTPFRSDEAFAITGFRKIKSGDVLDGTLDAGHPVLEGEF